MKDSIVVRELVRSVVRGSKVRLRQGEDFAEGYLLGVDEYDYLIGVTVGGDTILLMVPRRGTVVAHLLESTYADETDDVKDILDEYRQLFMEYFADVVAEIVDQAA